MNEISHSQKLYLTRIRRRPVLLGNGNGPLYLPAYRNYAV